jgi:hypothetical protein
LGDRSGGSRRENLADDHTAAAAGAGAGVFKNYREATAINYATAALVLPATFVIA